MSEKLALIALCQGTGQHREKMKSNICKLQEILKCYNGVTKTASGLTRKFKYFKGIGVLDTFEQIRARSLNFHVIEVYRWLAINYVPGSEIYLFGFSRGAFIVRSVIGMIKHYGIPSDRYDEETLDEDCNLIFQAYQRNNVRNFENEIAMKEIIPLVRRHDDVTIKFVVLFDTVSGLNEETENKHDYFIPNKLVESSLHLMAMNVTKLYQNVSFHCRQVDRGKNKSKESKNCNHEEYWFVGDHCDIGGGWLTDEREPSLSNNALQIMIQKCGVQLGIAFDDSYLVVPIDKLHNYVHSVLDPRCMKGVADKVKCAVYRIVEKSKSKSSVYVDQATCDGAKCPGFVSVTDNSSGSNDHMSGTSGPNGGSSSSSGSLGSSSSSSSADSTMGHSGGNIFGHSLSSAAAPVNHFACPVWENWNIILSEPCSTKFQQLVTASSLEEWNDIVNSFTSDDVLSFLEGICSIDGCVFQSDSFPWAEFWKCFSEFDGITGELSDNFAMVRSVVDIFMARTDCFNQTCDPDSIVTSILNQEAETLHHNVSCSVTSDSEFIEARLDSLIVENCIDVGQYAPDDVQSVACRPVVNEPSGPADQALASKMPDKTFEVAVSTSRRQTTVVSVQNEKGKGGRKVQLLDDFNNQIFSVSIEMVKIAKSGEDKKVADIKIVEKDREYMQRNVDDIDERDTGNPMLVTEYVNEMYDHFKEAEREFMVNPNYMTEQLAVNEKMRAILVDWLNEVHLKLKNSPESLYLAINIIDRYSQCKQVRHSKLQLVGIAALLIAVNYEEIYSLKLRDLVYVTDKAYTQQEILMMELDICNTLKYQFTVPTIHTFLCRYLKAAHADRTMVQLACYLAERSLQEYSTLRFLPSCIAASAVYVARKSLKRHPWSPTLLQYTDFREEDLLNCVEEMRRTYSDATNQQQAVLRKYSSSRFSGVANLPLSYSGELCSLNSCYTDPSEYGAVSYQSDISSGASDSLENNVKTVGAVGKVRLGGQKQQADHTTNALYNQLNPLEGVAGLQKPGDHSGVPV